MVAVVGAGALAAVVALLDWLRPAASRTHLGEFVESVFTGEAGAVVGRKLAQNVTNLGSPPLLGDRAGDGAAWSWPAGGSGGARCTTARWCCGVRR